MKIKELLNHSGRWTQGYFARAQSGSLCDAKSDEAVCWCLGGALQKCYGHLSERFEVYRKISDKIGIIPIWNDDPTRTFDEVKSLLIELDI